VVGGGLNWFEPWFVVLIICSAAARLAGDSVIYSLDGCAQGLLAKRCVSKAIPKV
tara:strand:+ start:486 stop:650 length:165 start_codon:yes stop_codon:yes gene_type:complete